jgi:cation:H+ antiporter
LIIIFIAAGAVTWFAGLSLTKATSTLDSRFKIGDALGGLILLGISGSLPEFAVTYSAAISGHIPVIIGNLLGGIAIQTVLIVLFDFAVKDKRPLSYLAGSPVLSLETLFAIIITSFALMGAFIPIDKNLLHTNPLSIVIVVGWVVGLFIINRARQVPRLCQTASDALPGRKHHERRAAQNHPFYANKSNLHVILIFLAGSIATLIAGIYLEETGSTIADRLGIGSGLFAATFIAFATSLPEISTGLKAIFIGDHHLAISDIMGGNAFMIVIFLFADIVTQKPILSYAVRSDMLWAGLGIVMMAVYGISFLLKLRRRYFRLGIDSILEFVLYIVGVVILTYFIT